MIHVERFGSGPRSYVGLHGWGGSYETFLPFRPYVPAAATFHSLDLPGYGRSPAIPGASAQQIADEAASCIRDLRTSVTVVGNCSGAIFGLLANGSASDRIVRLVLIDPFAFLPWYFRVFTNPHYGRVAYYSTFANPIGRWLTDASLKNRRKAETNLTSSFREIDHEVSLQYLAALAAVDGIERFRYIRTPIDIAYGARTFAAVKESVRQWQALWPHATTTSLTGAGHLPIEEATAEVAGIVFRER